MTEINQPPPPSRGSLSRSRAHRLRPPFSLTVAARALAASTVAYLEPHARGLKFAAYDDIVKQTLLPPFSEVAAKGGRGRDISKQTSVEQEEEGVCGGDAQSDEKTGDVANTTTAQSVDQTDDVANSAHGVSELRERFNGDYELFEKYDRSGKQRVRCLIAVVHGKVMPRDAGDKGTEDLADMQFGPGSISITFRGTDTLQNVIADVKAVTVPYNDPPFVPSGIDDDDSNRNSASDSSGFMKRATVHFGFVESWYGDNLRQTILQYAFDKLKELNGETEAARRMGLAILPSAKAQEVHHRGLAISSPATVSVDITGHSLGGSLAVLAAYDLAECLRHLGVANQSHIRVYTLGCPRVGNVKFAEAFNTLVPDCWNVLNDNDIVPGIPYSPKIVRSRLPAICPCKETGYKRHGRAVILKDNGTLVVDPSRWIKYRREVKTLRLKRAVDSHKTSSYREHIRAAIRSDIDEESRLNMPTSRDDLDNEAGVGLKEVDDLLARLGDVIGDALSDPNRSIRLLPGAT